MSKRIHDPGAPAQIGDASRGRWSSSPATGKIAWRTDRAARFAAGRFLLGRPVDFKAEPRPGSPERGLPSGPSATGGL